MTKIENQMQYEWAVSRVEELLPLVNDTTPVDDPNSIELELLSNLVADYSEEHFSLGTPTLADIIKLRIKNYAIGWEFTDFETRAVNDKTATYKYNSDTTLPEEEQFAKLKQHYQELSAGYIEYYDGDGNGSINLYEMFTFELAEYYESQGQSKQEAMNKAINKTREYMSMSFADIQNSTDTSFEMSILKQLQVRYGVLEDQANGMDINSLKTLDQDEVQAYLFAKAQYLDNKNSISANESFAVDADIMGARGDEEDSKIDLYLKGARDFLGL